MQERELTNRLLHLMKAGCGFHVTIDIDASTAYDGNQNFDRMRDLLEDSSLRFQIRKCDIKELAKMAASSTDDAAKKTFQE